MGSTTYISLNAFNRENIPRAVVKVNEMARKMVFRKVRSESFSANIFLTRVCKITPRGRNTQSAMVRSLLMYILSELGVEDDLVGWKRDLVGSKTYSWWYVLLLWYLIELHVNSQCLR